ncbi:MAG: AIR synthase-related protein [Lachnospiraceae bacterium]|nr:AIR synthase-related protein [Lachnospiraceae bacterium]
MLKQGSIEERILNRSVIKHIKKQGSHLVAGAMVGQDFGAHTCSASGGQDMDGACAASVFVTADGVSADPALAWTKAMNNFACSGGFLQGARVVMMVSPRTKETAIKRFMETFCALALSDHTYILGGHTQVDVAVIEPRFVVTMFGMAGGYRPDIQKIGVGCDIVMVDVTAKLGTALITQKKKEELRSRFAESYIKEMELGVNGYRVDSYAKLAAGQGAFYMHDISCGGLYGALWQLSVRIGKGIEIFHNQIPIRQETIELCEFYGINPYQLDGTGGLLVVISGAETFLESMAKLGVEAAVIGRVTEDQDKKIQINDTDIRYLTLVSGDEIYKVLDAV